MGNMTRESAMLKSQTLLSVTNMKWLLFAGARDGQLGGQGCFREM